MAGSTAFYITVKDHPHPLYLQNPGNEEGRAYTCSSCKTIKEGKRYTCKTCPNYILDEKCAIGTPQEPASVGQQALEAAAAAVRVIQPGTDNPDQPVTNQVLDGPAPQSDPNQTPGLEWAVEKFLYHITRACLLFLTSLGKKNEEPTPGDIEKIDMASSECAKLTCFCLRFIHSKSKEA